MAQKKFLTLPELEATLAQALEDDVLELDEIWSFTQLRKNKRWIWLALCRRTRQIEAFGVGNPGRKTCLLLWKAIPNADKKARLQKSALFCCCVAGVFQGHRARSVDSKRGQSQHQSSAQGAPEHFNGTLRQRLGRLVRETFSFSKTDFMHNLVLTLFIYDYNLSKITH